MKYSFRLNDVDKMEATLTLTMPLGDWKALEKQLLDGKNYAAWPGSNLTRAIQETVATAERTFYGEKDKENG